jgi:hypothetical protein
MKESRWDEETTAAIIAAARHWEEDICKPLREDRTIVSDVDDTLIWTDTEEIVPIGIDDCPLCERFISYTESCPACPLDIANEYCSDKDGCYQTFKEKDHTLENAEKMRDTILRLLLL